MKQIHLEGSWTINAPRDKVYEIVTDFEKMPDYFPSVAKSVAVTDRQDNLITIEATTKAFIGSKEFKVRMETELRPPEGFISVNTSSLGIEHETFLMKEIPEGTRIDYVNDVEIKSRFFHLFGGILIGKLALKYWERAVINKLRQMLEKD